MALVVSQRMDATERSGGGSVNMYTLTDTSNYIAEGLDPNDYIGVFKIVIPNGLEIYDNTNYSSPDISVGLGNKVFPLPTNADGSVMTGNYVVTISVKNTDTNVITSNTTTYVYEYDAVEIDISLTADGFNSTLTSVDETDYGTLSVVRDHTLVVPVGSGLVDQNTTSATISLPANIWSGDYTTTIIDTITYTNGLLIVTDEITESVTESVLYLIRDTVFDAVTAFNTLYNETLGVNPKLAITYGVISNRLNGYLREYQNGVEGNDGQRCYDALNAMVLILSPDFIDDLFVTTEEIIPFDFRPESEAEVLAFIQSLTATAAEINVLHGLSTVGKRVLYTNDGAIETDPDFTYDENGVDLPVGKKYRVNGVDILDVLDDYATLNSPTFTGTVDLPVDTNIGNVTGTEISYLEGAESNLQIQITEHEELVAVKADEYTPAVLGHIIPGAYLTIDENGVLNGQQGGTGGGGAWGIITGTLADQVDLKTALDLKANLISPTFTGVPLLPTAALGTNTTQGASCAFVKNEIAALVDTAPSTLDTLNELAAALGDDPNFSATMTTAIGLKAPKADPTLTGTATVQGTTKSRVVSITDNSDNVVWKIQLSTTSLEFYNSSNVLKMRLLNTGELYLAGNIHANYSF